MKLKECSRCKRWFHGESKHCEAIDCRLGRPHKIGSEVNGGKVVIGIFDGQLLLQEPDLISGVTATPPMTNKWSWA